MKTNIVVILIAVYFLAGCSGGLNSSINQASLNDVTKKGRLLYEYDLASWVASDSIMAKKPDQKNVQYYIAHKNEGIWTVVFGKLVNDSTEFMIWYEVVFGSDLKSNTIKEYFPPKRDTGWFYYASKALSLSKVDFGTSKIKYNYYVLSDTPNVFNVYFIPAQIKTSEMPLGGDTYYTVNSSGSEIIKKTKLHNSIINMPKAPNNVAAGMHSHVLIDTPVETDILYVLRQTPRVPHYVISSKYIYVIDIAGEITFENK